MRNGLDLFREGIWMPFWDMNSLHGEFPRQERTFNPACDVDESDGHFLVSLDMPGVAKEDISIEVRDNILTVSGSRKKESAIEKDSRHLTERFHGKFERVFELPSLVENEKIEASYTDGVLRIAIPKAEAVKPRQIKITEEKTGLLSRINGSKNERKNFEPPQTERAV
jgi:HSP20 family protein